LESLILCVDIGLDANTDFVQWIQPQKNIFRMDIIAAREMALEKYYLHIEKPNRRMVFIKDSNVVFLIIATEEVQYQLLEAILEQVISTFFNQYGEIYRSFLIGMRNIFDGFKPIIPGLFEEAQKNRIKWIQANCSMCQKNYYICVKKSLITEAKSFPVSLVFQHGGHGLLIYLDSTFKTRGIELVEITG